MASDGLKARGRMLEEAFFAGADERLRLALRAAGPTTAPVEAGAALGMPDEHRVLAGLEAHHIDADTVAALALIPLVAVAWADRDLHEAERRAVLEAAEATGIAAGSPSAALLASWLHARPDPDLFERWKLFIAALCAEMDTQAVEALRAELIDRARAVAEAAGGLLGLARISAREGEVLDELAHAFPA